MFNLRKRIKKGRNKAVITTIIPVVKDAIALFTEMMQITLTEAIYRIVTNVLMKWKTAQLFAIMGISLRQYKMTENINGVKKETNNTICFNSLGWYNIAGKHYYCAGNRVIPEPNFRYTVSEKLSPFKFEIDNYLDQSEAVEAALKIKDISESTSMILYVAGFVGICRQIFHDAGVKVSAPIYLFAETQSGKTTLAEVATRMYNRSKLRCEKDILSTRVNSTIAKTEELISEGKDTVFLLDDLYDTSNKNTKRLMKIW